MALYAAQNGGGALSSSGSWWTCATGSSSSKQLASKSNTTVNNLAISYSSNFTLDAGQTIDGVYLMLNAMTTPNGTFTITLSDDNGSTATYNETFNVSILPSDPTVMCFMFSTPIASDASKTYKLGIRSSISSQVNGRRDGTSGNWFRALRTTTAAASAPTAGDNLIVAAEYNPSTGLGVYPSITWDDTGATLFGDFSGNFLTVSRGTVSFGFSASTNYTLYSKGAVFIGGEGVLNCGTVANPIPASGSAEIAIYQNTTYNQFSLVLNDGGTFNAQGSDQGRATRALFAADASAGATTFTTNISTNWISGDIVVYAPTRRTYSQYEQKTLAASASGTTVTTPALTYEHRGSNGMQAEAMLMNRNVIVRGEMQSHCSSIYVSEKAVCDWDWVMFRWFGGSINGTSAYSQYGIEMNIQASQGGALSCSNCSFFDLYGGNIRLGASSDGWIFTNNVIFSQSSSAVSPFVYSAGDMTFDDNWLVGYRAVTLQTVGQGSFSRNRIAGSHDDGLNWYPNGDHSSFDFEDNEIHSAAAAGLAFNHAGSGTKNVTITRLISWESQAGVEYGGSNALYESGESGVIFSELTAFGNTANFSITKQGYATNIKIVDSVFEGGPVDVSQKGIVMSTNCGCELFVYNTTFGASVAHSVADINLAGAYNSNNRTKWHFQNCLLNSGTEIVNQSYMHPHDLIGHMKFDQVAGYHKAWVRYGTIESDQTIFKSATPSEKLIPSDASNKLRNEGKRISVKSGTLLSVSVYVRESVIGDGADYAGSRARLILLANPFVGVSNDTVLASASASSEGAWEQLSASLPVPTADCVMDLRIDCDGTTGWVNVDDWQVS